MHGLGSTSTHLWAPEKARVRRLIFSRDTNRPGSPANCMIQAIVGNLVDVSGGW